MQIILTSLILAVVAALGYFPMAFIFGMAAPAAGQDMFSVINVIAWIFMVLVVQPIVIVPGVIIVGLVKGSMKLFKKKHAE